MSRIADILGYQSPFLEYDGFKNRPTEDLKDILNQDAELSNEEMLQLISDGEIEVKRFLTYIDNNHNDSFDEGIDDLQYKTVIFTSRDAILLKKAYQSVTPMPVQILVFIEDNTDDISSQTHYIKIGDYVKQNLQNNIKYVDFSSLFSKYKIGDSDDDTEIHELIKKQFTELSNWEKVKITLSAIIIINQHNFTIVNDFGINILDSIINEIESWKIDPKSWNPAKASKDEFKPLFFPIVNETNTDLIKDGIKQNLSQYRENLKNAVNNGFNLHYTTLIMPGGVLLYTASRSLIADYKNQALTYIDELFDEISPIIDSVLDFVKKGVYFVNAILCGLINSIIEAIAGIFQIIKMIFKLANNIGSFLFNSSDLLEKLDNAVQALKKVNFSKVFSSIKIALSEIWDSLANAWDNTSFDFSAEEVGYFIGYIIGFILEIIVGIIFTGGVGSVKAVFQKAFVKSKKLIDDILEIISKQFSKFSTKISKDLVASLTDFLKKGTDNFLKLIKEIKETILKWFRKIKSIDPALMKRYLGKDFIKSLKKMDLDEQKILEYFSKYHNENYYRFLNDIEKLLLKYPKLSRDEALTLWGYTTDLFYDKLNYWLRLSKNSNKTKNLSKILTSALSKMPRYNGTLYRALKIDDIDTFLIPFKQGSKVDFKEFLSCGSSKEAAFFNKSSKNVRIQFLEVKDAPIISDFADGIKFRSYKREEILLNKGSKFEVLNVKEINNIYYIQLKQL